MISVFMLIGSNSQPARHVSERITQLPRDSLMLRTTHITATGLSEIALAETLSRSGSLMPGGRRRRCRALMPEERYQDDAASF